jgi:hypothetical protein
MKTFSLVGVGIGLAVFLATALLPALIYGGYAGLLLATGIVGSPVHPTFLVKTLIIFGMVMGVTSIASLFAVIGATLGTIVGCIVKAVTPARFELASED